MLKYNDHVTQTSNTKYSDTQQLPDTGASVKAKSEGYILDGISGHLNDLDLDSGPSVKHNFNVVDKCRGFLNRDSANLAFIGPDRDLTDITSIDQ